MIIAFFAWKVSVHEEKYIIGRVDSIDNVFDLSDEYLYTVFIVICEETNGEDFEVGDVIDVRSRTINGEGCPGDVFKKSIKVYYNDYIEYEKCVEISEVIAFELIENDEE